MNEIDYPQRFSPFNYQQVNERNRFRICVCVILFCNDHQESLFFDQNIELLVLTAGRKKESFVVRLGSP